MPIIDVDGMDVKQIVAIVFGTMFFSHDEDMRTTWICRKLLEYVATFDDVEYQSEEERMLNHLSYGKLLGAYACNQGGLKRFCDALFSRQYNTTEHEAREKTSNGMLMGRIFLYIFENHCSVMEACREISQGIDRGDIKKFRVSDNDMGDYLYKVWDNYKNAAHFWGAAVLFYGPLFCESIDNKKHEKGFLSRPYLREAGIEDGLSGFLNMADSFYSEAIKLYPKRRGPKTTLLDHEKAYRILPPRYIVPEMPESG